MSSGHGTTTPVDETAYSKIDATDFDLASRMPTILHFVTVPNIVTRLIRSVRRFGDSKAQFCLRAFLQHLCAYSCLRANTEYDIPSELFVWKAIQTTQLTRSYNATDGQVGLTKSYTVLPAKFACP